MAKNVGSIKKRGKVWWIRLYAGTVEKEVRGRDGVMTTKRVSDYKSFSFEGTKVEAQNFAKMESEKLAKDVKRAKAGRPGPIRFSGLLEQFKTYELPTLSPGAQESYLNSFAPFEVFFVKQLHDPMLRDITRGDVKTFLEWRRTYRHSAKKEAAKLAGSVSEISDIPSKVGVSAYTVARDRRVLHRLFNYGLEKDLLEANPCAKVRAPKSDPRTPPILTDEQLQTLLDKAADHAMLSMYILLLAETGVRAYSEALHLQWEDIDLVGGFVHVKSATGRRTKSGKSRHVPMTPRLREALQSHAAQFRMALYGDARSPFVFHHLHVNRTCKPGQRIKSLKQSFRNVIIAAKLPAGFRPHDLRHRRVTSWLAAGKSAVLVQEAMGHSSFATTAGYKHLVPEHLRELVTENARPEKVEKTG